MTMISDNFRRAVNTLYKNRFSLTKEEEEKIIKLAKKFNSDIF